VFVHRYRTNATSSGNSRTDSSFLSPLDIINIL
jgi:hypothetical protein